MLPLTTGGDMTALITEVSLFSLKSLADTLPRSELIFRDKESGVVVDGVVLEKQFAVQSGYLLFLTEDSPYEEGLHIYFLGADLQVLDALGLGGPYASAILKDVREETETSLTFSFFGDDQWRLQLAPAPSRNFDIGIFSPVKHKRGPLSKRWLHLERVR